MKITFLACAVAMIFSSGCMHIHKMEPVTASTQIENGVQVSIGASEIKVDEVINVFKNNCTKVRVHPRAQLSDSCKLSLVGKAKVAQVIDQKSAIVIPLDGLKMDSTMRFEKVRN